MTKGTWGGSTAMIVVLAGQGALAQVTPEEVWQNWQDLATSYGQTVTTTAVGRDGDTLVVEGLTLRQDQDGVVVDMTIDEVNFTDAGDGTVEVTMSDSYPIALTVPGESPEDGPTDLEIAVSQPGLRMTVGGTTDEISYDFEGPSIGFKLVSIDGVAAGAADVTADVTLTGVAGSYLIGGPAEARSIDATFDAQSLAMTVVASDPEEATDVRLVATVAGIAGTSATSLIGMDLAGTELAEALRAGFSMQGGLSNEGVTFEMDVTEATGPARIVATTGGGGLEFALGAAGLVYALTGTDTDLTISGPEIPLPEVNVTYSEVAFTLAMPLLAAADPADFTFLTRITDLSLSDDLWSLLDPSATLPRDPATVVIDTKGTARLTTDIVDEAAMEALGDVPPGELLSLDITELRAAAAGADLTGAGGFTFDNTDLVTFDGVPVPTGKLDLRLVGGNALIDKLVAMGLMTQDDAMGARLMMSMFANAGAEADTLTSTLEFKDKGFFANGQRLQ